MSLYHEALGLISDYSPFHTKFQVEQVIIGQSEFGDDSDESAFGAFRQIQREIKERLGSLNQQKTERLRLNLEILKNERDLARWFCLTRESKLRKKLAQSEIFRLTFELQELDRAATDLGRELEILVNRGRQLEGLVRSWDDTKREQVELVWWARKFERRIEAAYLYNGNIGEVVETLADLPEPVRTRLGSIAKSLNFAAVSSKIEELNCGSHYRRIYSTPALEHSGEGESPELYGPSSSPALADSTACRREPNNSPYRSS